MIWFRGEGGGLVGAFPLRMYKLKRKGALKSMSCSKRTSAMQSAAL